MLQWAALAFLGIFIVGLTRQLGMLVQPTDARSYPEGPAVGSTLPSSVLLHNERASVASLLENSGHLALLIVEKGCPDCDTLMKLLWEQASWRQTLPIAGLLPQADQEFLLEAGHIFRLVLSDEDGSRTAALGIGAFPAVLVLDPDLTVVAKGLGGEGVFQTLEAMPLSNAPLQAR